MAWIKSNVNPEPKGTKPVWKLRIYSRARQRIVVCSTFNDLRSRSHNRHIALLKRTQKQVKIGYRVYIYKTARIHSETILAVFPEIYYTELDELALLSANLFPSLMMLCSYGPQRFWATNSAFPCDHQNQLDKPGLIYCVTWLCKLISLSYDLFRGFYKLDTKLVNVTN